MKEDVDILDKALNDYFMGRKKRPKLWIHNHYGDPEIMDPGIYFRTQEQMPKAELFALSQCKGKILDVGAGVGAHSIPLQNQELDISALEISKASCCIMKRRGVRNIINKGFLDLPDGDFDMLLFMMNGIGIAESIKGLRIILNHSKMLLKPGGIILFDSSDVGYLYPESRLRLDPYYGEIDYQYQYGDQWSPWFKWLYIDQDTMKNVANDCNWELQILFEDQTGHYLGKLHR